MESCGESIILSPAMGSKGIEVQPTRDIHLSLEVTVFIGAWPHKYGASVISVVEISSSVSFPSPIRQRPNWCSMSQRSHHNHIKPAQVALHTFTRPDTAKVLWLFTRKWTKVTLTFAFTSPKWLLFYIGGLCSDLPICWTIALGSIFLILETSWDIISFCLNMSKKFPFMRVY